MFFLFLLIVVHGRETHGLIFIASTNISDFSALIVLPNKRGFLFRLYGVDIHFKKAFARAYSRVKIRSRKAGIAEGCKVDQETGYSLQ